MVFGLLNISVAVANLILHKEDMCEKAPTRHWWNSEAITCSFIEPMGSGLWPTPFLIIICILCKVKVTRGTCIGLLLMVK